MLRETAHAVRDPALQHYVAAIGRYPMLDADEERRLARRWRDHQDQAARDRLVTSHLRLAAKMARGFAGYGMAMADLISAGGVGLVRAVRSYDPELGFRFATYAAWWIRAEMQQFVLDNWSLVRISKDSANKRLFFKLRRLKSDLKVMDEGDLDPAVVRSIAEGLRVSPRAVSEMNTRLAGGELSLNVGVAESGEEWQDNVADIDEDPEAKLGAKEELAERRALLRKALADLSDRERSILVERRMGDERTTLDAISTQYGISRERVRQIEARAIEKVKASLAHEAVSHG